MMLGRLGAMSLLLLPCVAASFSEQLHHSRAPSRFSRRLVAPQSLIFSRKLPQEVADLVDPSMSESEVMPLWRELCACYASEAEAVKAAKKSPLVILPFFNTADNIRFCYQVLDELGFSGAERSEILKKYPGVLANKPGELARSSMDEVRFAVNMASTFDSVPEEIRFAIPSVTAITIVGLIAKRLNDCAGGICG